MGGTIDSYDSDIVYPLIPNEKSIIPTYIKSLKLANKTKFTITCLKDSREVSKADLKKTLGSIKNSTAKQIIVTTGTFAMPDIARFIDLNLTNNNKTIIITGSMIPMYGFPMSDAPFNLGYSVSRVQELSSGVYVCMNGKVFSSSEVMKIVADGKFDSIFD